MKVAHLILAHKNPKQLERFLNLTQHPNFYFYIHIDGKSDIRQFLYLANNINIFFIKKRAKIYWAGYGTIQATINGFKEILPNNYDYINVISAQDFPLKTAEELYQYLLKNNNTEYITCDAIDERWDVAPRVYNYNFINWRIPGKYRLEKIANVVLPKRRFPFPYTIVGRANWFTLTTSAAKYILSFIDKHPEIVRYFKYCWGADEFMFSTILYNSSFKKNIVDNLVYVDWSEGNAHPKILTANDFEALKKTDKFFARKFDAEKDGAILNMLEEWIRSKHTLPA